MRRRFLPALTDHRFRDGAFATEWEGWVNPRDRNLPIAGRINVKHPSYAEDVEDRIGCYAILYRTSGSESLYVAYIGYSATVGRELSKRIKEWDIKFAQFPFTCIFLSNSNLAKEYEEDLIRYYCPPWNIRFSK